MFVKKWPLEYQKVIETYLPTYLWDSSDSSDSSDSNDSSDSSDFFVTKILYWLKKFCNKNCATKIVQLKLCN